jgi:hypothetical protein
MDEVHIIPGWKELVFRSHTHSLPLFHAAIIASSWWYFSNCLLLYFVLNAMFFLVSVVLDKSLAFRRVVVVLDHQALLVVIPGSQLFPIRCSFRSDLLVICLVLIMSFVYNYRVFYIYCAY